MSTSSSYADVFPKVVSHCKEHGFIFQSSEIYDGLGAVYDYGSLGVLMKNNLKNLWWKQMVQLHTNIVGLDAAILMHPKVWKASGHVDAFSDPLIDNKASKRRYRADVLVEEYIDKLMDKARKETEKKFKKEGREDVPAEEFTRRIAGDRSAIKAEEARLKLAEALNKSDMEALKQIIVDCEIADPDTGSRDWTDVRQFNLMFSSELGSVAGESTTIYLRPETAQGIFVNFLNVQKSMRLKIPFGIAQIGKAFRNEIVARQFIFRMREFEQMEMQYFIKPGTQKEWYNTWKEARMQFHKNLGLDPEKLRFKDHDKLAHYADAAVDIQFDLPFGWKELEGIHSRTDYDLGRHQEFSTKKLQYFDTDDNTSYTPYVVETSVGLDRTFLVHLCNGYTEEMAPTAEGGQEVRTVLKLHPLVAPITAAILPLVKNDNDLVQHAENLAADLRWDFHIAFDEKDSIGRRYRRQDGRGTPYCITIDADTLTDGTVTIRDRDTLKQERIAGPNVKTYLADKLDIRKVLK